MLKSEWLTGQCCPLLSSHLLPPCPAQACEHTGSTWCYLSLYLWVRMIGKVWSLAECGCYFLGFVSISSWPPETHLVSLTLMAKQQVAHHVTHINKRLHF